jgi:multidrug resistance protein, MATE family
MVCLGAAVQQPWDSRIAGFNFKRARVRVRPAIEHDFGSRFTRSVVAYERKGVHPLPDRAMPAPPPRTSSDSMDAPSGGVVTQRSGTAREVIGFSIPLMISHLSLSAMWVVDTLIMGRVGTAEQGAVGLGGVLTWSLACFFAGTTTAVNVLVAQDHGAGRKDVRRHVRTGLALMIPLAIAMVCLWSVVPHALGWIGASPQVRPHAQVYIQVRLLSAPFFLGSFVLMSYLRGTGDMVTPMLVALIANVCNAALALVLVFGAFGLPAMKVAGAAWATTIASTLECCMYAGVYWYRRPKPTGAQCRAPLPSLSQVRQFAALGMPIGLTWLFENIAWTAFSAYAGTRTPVELASHMILFQFTGFCFMPAAAIGVAASTLVGQYLGARRPDLAGKTAHRSLALGVGYMAVVGLGLVIVREPLIRAFNPDPSVVAMGCALAILAGAYQPFDGFGIISQAILRGAGRTGVPTLVMLGSGVLVFVPAVIILGNRMGMGIRGAWTAALLHVFVVAAVLGVAIFRGKWKQAVPLSELAAAGIGAPPRTSV